MRSNCNISWHHRGSQDEFWAPTGGEGEGEEEGRDRKRWIMKGFLEEYLLNWSFQAERILLKGEAGGTPFNQRELHGAPPGLILSSIPTCIMVSSLSLFQLLGEGMLLPLPVWGSVKSQSEDTFPPPLFITLPLCPPAVPCSDLTT